VSSARWGRKNGPLPGLGLLILFLLLAPALVWAQGNGNGHAYGLHKVRPTGPSSAGSLTIGSPDLPDGTGVPNFGSWLDDASLLPEGRGSFGVAFGFYRSPAFTEVDVPVVDTAVGVHPRVQVGASVPYFHVSAPGVQAARGVGDVYLTAKVLVAEPKPGRLGFAVTPLVEILSSPPTPEASRLAWALPGSVELREGSWRAFASAGYFSRGSLFASGAVERTLSERVGVTASISRSHALRLDPLSAALGLSQSRTDVTGGASVQAGNAMSVFGAVGRTISRRDATSASFTLSAGVSIGFAAWR
jgi:hypothetical protein